MTAELLELGTKPVGPDAPSGVSARDEADFAVLQAEIRKLEAADRPAVNWDLVVRNGTVILSGRSKDVLVAAYLTVGLLERRGFEGLADGLTVLRDVLTNFWETLYPEVKRARGRLAAFEWLSERGGAAVVRLGERPVKAAVVETCQERVQQISDFIADKLDGGSSALSDLRSALNGVNLEGAAPSAAAAGAPAGAAAGPRPAPAPAVGSVTDDTSAEQAIAEAKRLMRAAGEYLRGKDPKDPVGYRLPRLAAWMTLRQPPPSANGGKTQIPPPQPADLLPRLEGMLQNAQFAGVLQETEGRIGTAVMWLDLHRLAASALDRMGADHAAASAAVAAEVRALLLRIPGLQDLQFANDQPLATPETKTWIQNVVMAGSGDGGGAAATARGSGDAEDPFEALRIEALQLARQKKLPEALGRLSNEARRAPRLRDRVRLELEAAKICMEQGHLETALAQLEGLEESVRGGGIEAWDPEVSGEVLRNLIACRQRAGAKTPEDGQRIRDLLQRLSRLDVVATLDLSAKR